MSRRAVPCILAFGLLLLPAAIAAAAESPPKPSELWREFPLDPSVTATVPPSSSPLRDAATLHPGERGCGRAQWTLVWRVAAFRPRRLDGRAPRPLGRCAVGAALRVATAALRAATYGGGSRAAERERGTDQAGPST